MEKEAKMTQQTIIVTNANIMMIQRHVERQKKRIFNSACSHANMGEVRNRLHRHIVVDVLTHVPLSNN